MSAPPVRSLVLYSPYLLLVYGVRLIASLVLAYPVAEIAAMVAGARPGGDATLLRDGGLLFVEVWRLHAGALRSLVQQGMLAVIALAPVGLVLTAILIAALARQPRSQVASVVADAVRSLKPMALLLVVFGASIATVLATGMSLIVELGPWATDRFGVRTTMALAGAVLVTTFAFALWLRILLDLARSAVIARGNDAPDSLTAAWRTWCRYPAGCVSGYWVRAALGAFLVVLTLTLTGLSISPRAGSWLVVVAHQLVLIALVVLRASWLQRALWLVISATSAPEQAWIRPEEESDRAGHSGEPPDPSRHPGA